MVRPISTGVRSIYYRKISAIPVRAAGNDSAGLIINTSNDRLINNAMTPVMLCKRRVIAFSTSSRNAGPVQQAHATAPDKEEAESAIHPIPDGAAIHSQQIACLHIPPIGLRDAYPRYAFDDAQGVSTVVSIPFPNGRADDFPVINSQPIKEAAKPAIDASNESLFYGIKLLSVKDIKGNTIFSRTEANAALLRFRTAPADSGVYVCRPAGKALRPVKGYAL